MLILQIFGIEIDDQDLFDNRKINGGESMRQSSWESINHVTRMTYLMINVI